MNNDLEKRLDNLEKDLKRVKSLYEKSIKFKKEEPEIALSQARKSVEAICKQIYINEGMEKGGKPASRMMLDELSTALDRKGIFPVKVSIAIGAVQRYGNFGSHDQGHESDDIGEEFVNTCLSALSTVIEWYFNKYHQKSDIIDITILNVTAPTPQKEPVTVVKEVPDTGQGSNVKPVTASSEKEPPKKREGAKRFSMEEGNYSDKELEDALKEYFSPDGKTEGKIERRIKVRSYLKILLSEDRPFKRDELKQIINEKGLWLEAHERSGSSLGYSGYVGNQMSHVSKEFSNKNNDFLRQIISFDSLARAEVKAGEAGAKKDTFYLKSEYRKLIGELVTNI